MTMPAPHQWLYPAGALRRHLRARWWAYLLAALAYSWCSAHYRLALNMSDSLPDVMYLVVLDSQPTSLGDYVAFEWQRNVFYRRNWIFVKRVAGLPGQCIDVRQRSVFIDGTLVGYAKPRSSWGVPLQPIQPGIIPYDFVYAAAPHPDSLDSRYSVTGLINSKRIVGRAYAIY